MEALELRESCPDCNSVIGQLHTIGCDVERCPFCGGQLISDDCSAKYFEVETRETEDGDIEWDLTDEQDAVWEKYLQAHRMPWDGAWPGTREAIEYDLWCRWSDGEWPENGGHWERCSKDDPGARPDLNELMKRSTWDAERKRRVIRQARRERSEGDG